MLRRLSRIKRHLKLVYRLSCCCSSITSTPAFSTHAQSCRFFHSYIFHPGLQNRADVSTPAFSTPAESCRCFHSCILHLCILDRADFSTPAFSVAPTGTGAHDQSPGHRPHSQLQALRAFAAYDLTDLEMTPWRRPCYFRQLISSNGPLV